MAGGLAAHVSDVDEHGWELRKETLTMALYVAICLMAAFIATPEGAISTPTRWA